MEIKSRMISLWGYDSEQAEKKPTNGTVTWDLSHLIDYCLWLAYTSHADAQVQEKGKKIFMKLNFRWFGDKTFAPNKA